MKVKDIVTIESLLNKRHFIVVSVYDKQCRIRCLDTGKMYQVSKENLLILREHV